MYAYRYCEHEQRVAALAREIGFPQVSVSHEVSPLIKLVGRGDTTVVDAYLSPILQRYVSQVARDVGTSGVANGDARASDSRGHSPPPPPPPPPGGGGAPARGGGGNNKKPPPPCLDVSPGGPPPGRVLPPGRKILRRCRRAGSAG